MPFITVLRNTENARAEGDFQALRFHYKIFAAGFHFCSFFGGRGERGRGEFPKQITQNLFTHNWLFHARHASYTNYTPNQTETEVLAV